ncbi:hypothetical protein CDAR_554381 [Caerostris darwini]|uniref:Uncharacterized protein n=1 Tax=Caerostris darwini TaxID=1538125 RepID=A0AAV4SKK2_9ARAC|nr:hypothetical protein CDAR_554381 [Caerostris darwini]
MTIKEHVKIKQDDRKPIMTKIVKTLFYTWSEVLGCFASNQPCTQKENIEIYAKTGWTSWITQRSPIMYEDANFDNLACQLEHHVSALIPFTEVDTLPIVPLGKRGSPMKSDAVSSTSRNRRKRCSLSY